MTAVLSLAVDVDLSGLQDGDTLVYQASTKKWLRSTTAGGLSGNISVTNVVASGTGAFTGNVSAGNLSATAFTGNVTGTLTGNVTATSLSGNLTGASGNLTGNMRAASYNVGASAGIDGTINVGSTGNLTFSKGILITSAA